MGASVSTRITRLPSRVNRDQARRALGSKHWSDKRWDGIPKEADGRVRRDHLLTALEDHIDDAPVAAVRAGGAGGGAGAAYTSSTSTITSRAGSSSSSSSDHTTSSSSTTVTVSAASATGTSTSTGTSTQSKSVKKRSGPSPLSPAAEEAARNHPSVRMAISYGRQASDKGSASLLKAIGGSARLRSMASRFYQKAFKDQVIDKFIESHKDPHGQRLGDWIAEKMGGEGAIWTDNRPPDSRQRSHSKAWHSRKRESSKKGRRFKLDDCRVWMRLMFWAARDEGLAEYPAFWEWYVDFIGHFIRVYERSAPPYTEESAEWSADPANIAKYEADGRLMKDVVGKSVGPFSLYR